MGNFKIGLAALEGWRSKFTLSKTLKTNNMQNINQENPSQIFIILKLMLKRVDDKSSMNKPDVLEVGGAGMGVVVVDTVGFSVALAEHNVQLYRRSIQNQNTKY